MTLTALRTALLLSVVFALTGTPARAQINFFGQNKIQYRDFEWKVLAGEHVDLYFYPEEEELARVALTYAEESYDFLVQKFGHSPPKRIPLIIYASHTDFEQTNILPFVPPEAILGVTEFLKRRVTVPFKGNYAQFRHTLRHELVHAFQLSINAERFRRYPGEGGARTPLWWSEGIAEYWSGGENSQDEMVVRALAVAGRIPSIEQFNRTRSGLVYPLGGMLHGWLAQNFGDWRVQVLYRDLWKYRSFNAALEGVYGIPVEELNSRFQHFIRQKYFPVVTEREPLDLTSQAIAELAIKPVVYQEPDSSIGVLYLTPRSGYMNIVEAPLRGAGEHEVVVKGERSAEFESFHPFGSRMSVRDGILSFSSKYLDRDALYFWDLEKQEMVGRYQFPRLVSVLSPQQSPDGRGVVFSGLSESGYSDLYRLDLETGQLEQLTSDRFQDLDPSYSPDGKQIVFSSDRAPHGIDGYTNLFILDLESLRVRPLTYGGWNDQAPRWSEDGLIVFASDRDGVFNVYSTDEWGRGHQLTNTLSGAFDPQWIPSTGNLVYSGFHELSWSVFRTTLDSTPRGEDFDFELSGYLPVRKWEWPELSGSPYANATPTSYQRRFSLDFAAGDAIVAPGVGSAQGALFLFSDFLSDHLVFLNVSSFSASDAGNLIDNINGSVFYLNQKRRLNWGLGAFRSKGIFFEGDLTTIFDESSFGGFATIRWPFSRFSRVEGQFRVERSDRLDRLGGGFENPRRVGWLFSNFISYVRDNSLWLPSGPIDGQRTNLTAGISNDITNGRFDAWSVSLDHRRYLRLGRFSAYAVRAFGYWADGERPRRISVGGPLGLRGYPRIGRIDGTRAFTINQEVRFPIADFVAFGTPLGLIAFPGIQGAIFADVGGAWFADSQKRGVLTSTGLGLRMPIAFPLVLRLDLGYRFALGETSGYAITAPSEGRGFVDFFFGFNY